MDSLTQITLGAAVAEVVAGKKLGNRALVWGAIAGTIPDLDVVSNVFISEINALAYHRGFSHSFVFAFLAAWILPMIVTAIYRSKYHKYIAATLWFLVPFAFCAGFFAFIFEGSQITVWHGLVSIIILGLSAYLVKRRYFDHEITLPDLDISLWRKLFFWSIITHPILDSFTAYGTQLFLPFSDYRVSFNNISVVDVFYTGPFLLCVIATSFFARNSPKRRWVNYAGLIISSLYMAYTFVNKSKAEDIFEDTLAQEEVIFDRCLTAPTITQNILWYGAAMTDSTVYFGNYSFWDKEENFKLYNIPRNQHLIDAKPDDRVINILDWFSNGYWAAMIRDDGQIQMNDMRYGTFRPGSILQDDFVFRFVVEKQPDGYYRLITGAGGPPPGQEQDMVKNLIARIKGI